MVTRKKRSKTAQKQGTKRPAAKKTVRKGSSPKKKAPGKKAVLRKKVAAPGRSAAPRKKSPSRKAAPAKKPVAPKKTAKAAPRRARRPAKAPAFINPQQQLAKVLDEVWAPSTRGASRGLEGPALPAGFFSGYTGAALTEQDYADAAQTLGCEVAAVKAVAQVETAGASFDASNRPTILYERHVFSRNTVPPGKFDQASPDLSGAKPYPPGAYGPKSQQYVKLAQAFELEQDAALKAPSWGKFQILGENYKACGFASVADFVKAMTVSEAEHLQAFVRFLLSSPKRREAIRNKDWASFARYYNGPDYAKFQYDTKLAAAYAAHAQAG
jgi:hypothetical protein